MEKEELKILGAVNSYYASENGSRESNMRDLMELSIEYIENGGSVEKLSELLEKGESHV